MTVEKLLVESLDREAFSAFGQVIEPAGSPATAINAGTALRYSNLAHLDVVRDGGRPALHIYRARRRPAPIRIAMMERHPLGSQAFASLDRHPFLVVVSLDVSGRPGPPRAFCAAPNQGVNYRRGTWHHPLLALRDPSEFLVVDRGGPGDNLEEADFAAGVQYELVVPDDLTDRAHPAFKNR